MDDPRDHWTPGPPDPARTLREERDLLARTIADLHRAAEGDGDPRETLRRVRAVLRRVPRKAVQ